jgi:hypothetical protein
MDVFERARGFVRREGRVLDQRMWDALYEGAPQQGVIDALRAYRNPDGGFGHGLEPDKRTPDSQPLDVEVAFEIMDRVGRVDEQLVRDACDFLDGLARPDGAVPIVLPSIADHPRAAHWDEGFGFAPGLNPTASLAGRLHRFGVEHPWRGRATDYCWGALESDIPGEAHTLDDVAVFLEHVPDRARAGPLMKAVGEALPTSSWYLADPSSDDYGVPPFHFAPTPASPWRAHFDDAHIEGHLDRLERLQQPDGGWAIAWEPPSAVSVLEWRAFQTVLAVGWLLAYGRIER